MTEAVDAAASSVLNTAAGSRRVITGGAGLAGLLRPWPAADPAGGRYGYEPGLEVRLNAWSLYTILIRLAGGCCKPGGCRPRRLATQPGTCTGSPRAGWPRARIDRLLIFIRNYF